VPLSKTGAELLFELISQRYERGSTLITSNPGNSREDATTRRQVPLPTRQDEELPEGSFGWLIDRCKRSNLYLERKPDCPDGRGGCDHGVDRGGVGSLEQDHAEDSRRLLEPDDFRSNREAIRSKV
jgi:hypothetical protein